MRGPTAVRKVPLSKLNSSPLSPIPATPPRPIKKEHPSHKAKITKESFSPDDLSDSDLDQNYLNVTFQELAAMPKRRTASHSGSESSILSDDSSQRGSVTKRPIATPRTKTFTSVKAGHTVVSRVHSEELRSNPPLPPKPFEPKIPARPYLPEKKSNSLESVDNPCRPKQRPRMSEIKRAKDRARSNNPATFPSLLIVDEDGLETMSMSSSRSGASTSSNTSSKSAPQYGTTVKAAAGKQKMKSVSSNKRGERRQHHLSPEQPRHRHKSEGQREQSHKSKGYEPSLQMREPLRRTSEGEKEPLSRTSKEQRESLLNDEENGKDPSTPRVPVKVRSRSDAKVQQNVEDGPLNPQMADKLLRFIIKSEDPSLKEALRDLIAQDSNVVNSINE